MLDKKSKIVSDSILSIKNIKFNAWERFIFDKLKGVRKFDNKLLLSNLNLQGVSTSIVAMIPSITGLFCLAYLKFVLHKEIHLETVYAILIYFNYLKKMMILGNGAIAAVNASYISLERVSNFLDIEDLKIKKNRENHRILEEIKDRERLPSEAIILSDCSMKWENEKYKHKLRHLVDSKSEEATGLNQNQTGEKNLEGFEMRDHQNVVCLRGISLQAGKGSFSAVIGQVGSGKSSLLRGLLGDLTIMEGDYQVNGSVSYIPQEAFLINDTLKNNILFGKPYDEEKYNRVLDISQLRPDLEMLIEGDMTEIGERGLNLSGGQKQRISIARAIYSDSDIYLVDDCMSALDSHVGGAILEEVFFGHLKGKTILMTTHRYHFLDRVDQVYVLKGEEIITGGDYGDIKTTKEFKKLIKVEKNKILQEEKNQSNKRQENKLKLPSIKEGRSSLIKNLQKQDSKAVSSGGKYRGRKNKILPKKVLGQKEHSRKGSISFQSFKFYFSNGGVGLSTFVCALFAISVLLSIFSDWWGGAWISGYLDSSLTPFGYLFVYIGLLVIGAIIYILKFYLIGKLSCRASLNIFKNMMWNVLRRAFLIRHLLG